MSDENTSEGIPASDLTLRKTQDMKWIRHKRFRSSHTNSLEASEAWCLMSERSSYAKFLDVFRELRWLMKLTSSDIPKVALWAWVPTTTLPCLLRLLPSVSLLFPENKNADSQLVTPREYLTVRTDAQLQPLSSPGIPRSRRVHRRWQLQPTIWPFTQTQKNTTRYHRWLLVENARKETWKYLLQVHFPWPWNEGIRWRGRKSPWSQRQDMAGEQGTRRRKLKPSWREKGLRQTQHCLCINSQKPCPCRQIEERATRWTHTVQTQNLRKQVGTLFALLLHAALKVHCSEHSSEGIRLNQKILHGQRILVSRKTAEWLRAARAQLYQDHHSWLLTRQARL